MKKQNIFLILAITLGLIAGIYPTTISDLFALVASQIFINLQKILKTIPVTGI